MGRKSRSNVLPLPPHYDPTKVVDVRFIDYQGLFAAAEAWRRQHDISASINDAVKIALLCIDCQNTFCSKHGELYVAGRSGNGAVDDSRRLVEFIYRYLCVLSKLLFTFDTHLSQAIFHPSFLIDENGNHPAPFTVITYEDVAAGKWSVTPHAASALETNLAGANRYLLHYCAELKRKGRYGLTIWPFHGMIGGPGHALVSGLEEAAFFHSIARGAQIGVEVKGGNPWTENYSVLGPEVLVGPPPENQVIAQRNVNFIRQLLTYDKVIIVGQAKSHCVAWTIDDLLEDILKVDPALARKIYLVVDCTSPVVVHDGRGGFLVDYTDEADKAFARFEAAGMHVVKSTDPIETWPGMNL